MERRGGPPRVTHSLAGPPITMTIKVPYSSDLMVSSRPDTTISHLLNVVIATCPPELVRNIPQCIVYSGRILDDTATLIQAAITDGAVLHLMRRPSQTRRMMDQSSQSSGHEHHHHRPHSHGQSHQNSQHPHSRTNYRTHRHTHRIARQPAHSHALTHSHARSQPHAHTHVHSHPHGHSHRHSHRHSHSHAHSHGHSHSHSHGHGHSHGHPHSHAHVHSHSHGPSHSHLPPHSHAPIDQNAHHGHFHHHHYVEQDGYDQGHDHDHDGVHSHDDLLPENQNSNNGQGAPNPNTAVQANVMIRHVSVDGSMEYDDIMHLLSSILHSVGLSDFAVATGSAAGAAIAMVNNSLSNPNPSALNATRRLAWAAAQAARPPNESPLPSLPLILESSAGNDNRNTADNSQGIGEENGHDNENETAPSARVPPPHVLDQLNVADVLLRTLPGTLRHAASVAESDVPLRMYEQGDNGTALDNIVHTLATTAHAISSIVALLSTALPNASTSWSEGIQNAYSRHYPHTVGSDTGSESDDEDDSSHAVEESGDGTAPSGIVIVDSNSETEDPRCPDDTQGGRDASHDPGAVSRSRNEAGEGVNRESSGRQARPSGAMSSRRRNADFMVRFLCYYFSSMVDIGGDFENTGPTDVNHDAVAVLDDVYGGSMQMPVNKVLQILYRVMQKLSPQDVHAILSGDFRSVATKRGRIWEIITELVPDDEREHSGEEGNDSDDISDVRDRFVEVVCDGLHDFIHMIERLLHSAEGHDVSHVDEGFCHSIMHGVQSFAVDFVDMMTDMNRDDGECAEDLRVVFRHTLASMFCSLASEMHVNFDSMMGLMRIVLAEVSVDVFGRRCAALLPLMGNLFMGRLKELVDSNGGHGQRLNNVEDPSDEQPSGSTSAPGHARHAHGEDGGVHYRAQQDRNQARRPSNGPGTNITSTRGGQGSANFRGNQSTGICREGDSAEMNTCCDSDCCGNVNMDEVYLDDDELGVLAAELDEEFKGSGDRGENDDGDCDMTQLDELARELESERKHSVPHGSTSSSSVPPARPGRGVSVGQVGLGLGGATAIAGPTGPGIGSVGGNASFSRFTAVPRSSEASRRDAFDTALSTAEAGIWRRIVLEDERQIARGTHSSAVLSRGYRFDRTNVPVLDVSRASSMAAESARIAGTAGQLSEDAMRQLQHVAEESGTEYLRELENAITSRLTNDPDFDAERFPEANRRFLENSR